MDTSNNLNCGINFDSRFNCLYIILLIKKVYNIEKEIGKPRVTA